MEVFLRHNPSTAYDHSHPHHTIRRLAMPPARAHPADHDLAPDIDPDSSSHYQSDAAPSPPPAPSSKTTNSTP